MGGIARNRIAAIDAGTGVPTAWNPNANSDVLALAVSGSTIYVAGGFTTIGGQTSGVAAPYNPGPTNLVDIGPYATSYLAVTTP